MPEYGLWVRIPPLCAKNNTMREISGIKMLDEILQDCDEEIIQALIAYNKKIKKAPAPGSFIICSAELAEEINKINNDNLSNL